MAVPLIPMRPNQGKFDLKAEEMNCLNWIVLSGCTREDAFLRFVRPDYMGTKSAPAIKEAVKQFFAMAQVREYMEAYKETISSRPRPKEHTGPAITMEEKKAKAKSKLVEFAMSLADNIDQADDPEFVLKIADKAGLLDQDEEVVEQPRRYLPVTCGNCEYKKFVEENCDREEDGTEFEGESQT